MITLQQAVSNALTAWLQSQLPSVQILSQWPSPDAPFPNKCITLDLSGARRDTEVMVPPEYLLYSTPIGSAQTSGRYMVSVFEQVVQLDVWARSDPERDDILARLDIALNAGTLPIGGYNPIKTADGILCRLSGDWADTFADFYFSDMDTPDSPDTVRRAEFRATLRGFATISLAVTRQTARQVLINFRSNVTTADQESIAITSAGNPLTL